LNGLVVVDVLNREREFATHKDFVVLGDDKRVVFAAAYLGDLELREMPGCRGTFALISVT
jgi:hypothetical protein